jgi:hypothetical protein
VTLGVGHARNQWLRSRWQSWAYVSGGRAPDPDIEDLERALAEDERSAGTGTLGPATATWVERFRAEAGEQTIALANGVTAGVITELLMRFFA